MGLRQRSYAMEGARSENRYRAFARAQMNRKVDGSDPGDWAQPKPQKRGKDWGSKVYQKALKHAEGFVKYMKSRGKTLSKDDLIDAILREIKCSRKTAEKVASEVLEEGTLRRRGYLPESMLDNIKKKFGIEKLEKANPSHSVYSIGFSPKRKKWYGWSHRAIFGFGIGDKIFQERFGDDKTHFARHGKKTIKTMADAKKAAIAFSRSVA